MGDKINRNIPLDGDLSVSTNRNSSEKITRVSNRHIYDSNGKRVATYSSRTTEIDKQTGKRVKVYSYNTSRGSYRLIGNKLFFNGKHIGSTKAKQSLKVTISILVSILLLLLCLFLGLLYFNQRPVTVRLGAGDSSGEWNERTKIAVFDPTIQPGSSGEYEFYVVNESDITLTYTFTIQEMFNNINVYNFPMQYRVLLDEEEVTNWTSGVQLKVTDLVVEPNKRHDFTLEWRWLFESGNDQIDTYFGQDGGQYSIYLNLSAEQYMEE